MVQSSGFLRVLDDQSLTFVHGEMNATFGSTGQSFIEIRECSSNKTIVTASSESKRLSSQFGDIPLHRRGDIVFLDYEGPVFANFESPQNAMVKYMNID